MVNASEIRKKTDADLKAMLVSLEKDVQDHVSEILKSKSKNTSKIRTIRRSISQVRTVLNEKKILAEVNLGKNK